MTRKPKNSRNWIVVAIGSMLFSIAGTATAQIDDVTYSRDIAPILQERCQTCHRVGRWH